MSDRFGPPRVIVPRPVARPVAGVDRRLLAQADRAMTALDAFLAGEGSNVAPPADGSPYREELGQLRRRLLLFRQQVAAGESPEALSRSFGEIEDLNRRLGERARSESRIFRGGVRLDPRGLEATAQAVEKLRGLHAEGRGCRPTAHSVGCAAMGRTRRSRASPAGLLRPLLLARVRVRLRQEGPGPIEDLVPAFADPFDRRPDLDVGDESHAAGADGRRRGGRRGR